MRTLLLLQSFDYGSDYPYIEGLFSSVETAQRYVNREHGVQWEEYQFPNEHTDRVDYLTTDETKSIFYRLVPVTWYGNPEDM